MRIATIGGEWVVSYRVVARQFTTWLVRPPNQRLQLTPNSSVQSFVVVFWRRGTVPQRRRLALLCAAEPPIRWAALPSGRCAWC